MQGPKGGKLNFELNSESNGEPWGQQRCVVRALEGSVAASFLCKL